MKSDMRRELAREPFEKKIRKVSQLIQLSAKLKAQRASEPDTKPFESGMQEKRNEEKGAGFTAA